MKDSEGRRKAMRNGKNDLCAFPFRGVQFLCVINRSYRQVTGPSVAARDATLASDTKNKTKNKNNNRTKNMPKNTIHNVPHRKRSVSGFA